LRLAAAVAVLLGAPASAQQLEAAAPWSISSANGRYQLAYDPKGIDTPAELEAMTARSQELAKKGRALGAAERTELSRLKRRNRLRFAEGEKRLWSRPEGAYAKAFIAADGRVALALPVLTDERAPAVEIIATDGSTVKELSVSQLISAGEIAQLKRSRSHLTWLSDASLDEEKGQLVLKIALPQVLEKRVALATGAIVP